MLIEEDVRAFARQPNAATQSVGTNKPAGIVSLFRRFARTGRARPRRKNLPST
jgi:hypothetical protein